MAPRLTRWVAVTLAACGAVALAYLPPRGSDAGRVERRETLFAAQLPTRTAARRRAQSIAEEWRVAHAAVRLAEARVHAGALPSRQPALLLSGGDGALQTRLDSTWAELRLAETKIRVVFLIDVVGSRASDAITPRADASMTAYLLPHGANRTICVVRVPLARRWLEHRPPEREWLRAMLGPCGFYAAYGAPGVPVRRWLGHRGFDLLTLAPWEGPATDDAESALRLTDPPWWRDFVYHHPPDAVGCMSGREIACRRAVLWGMQSGIPTDSLPSVVVQDRRWWRRQRLIGSGRFLADLARDIGPERFQEFWSSTLPVDTSLALALREPIGKWTARWQLGIAPRIRLGPGMPCSGWLTGAGLGIAAVFLVAMAAGRRQVR